jgi:hypothetical protein
VPRSPEREKPRPSRASPERSIDSITIAGSRRSAS